MKDQTVTFLGGVLGNLVDSLEATVKVAQWEGGDAVPEPLQQTAAQLTVRLGSANRVATGKYVGSPAVVKASGAICQAIRRLDDAFVAYRRALEGSGSQKQAGAASLLAEIARVRADSSIPLSAR